ncbi:hypothetical protein Acr_12g0009220 [Actinidia rufa]|uniref:Uncharacterized protein n=1 Tax=Actinidia rufa TaxID=165716 RepID=A0A7J0FI76_9ERIC|nr:hypothetical protein Acr_12g0009220 [Actinidia rufa]
MEIEPSPPKKLWKILKIVFFMMRKGISKSKLMLDFHMLMKRSKLAGKALTDHMLPPPLLLRSQLPLHRRQPLLRLPPRPLLSPRHPALFLPGFGFGKSPAVRQLRITDSPFPVKDEDGGDGKVDKQADEFIKKFYKELKHQKEDGCPTISFTLPHMG